MGAELDLSISSARRHRRDLEGGASNFCRNRICTSVAGSRGSIRATAASKPERARWSSTTRSSRPCRSIDCSRRLTAQTTSRRLRRRFVHSSSHIVGVGLRGTVPDALKTKCWIYFPEPHMPFYRATVFSNYSANNAPPGHWSLMAEVSESPQKPVMRETVIDDVVAAFVAVRIHRPIAGREPLASPSRTRLSHAMDRAGRSSATGRSRPCARPASPAAAALAPGSTKSRTRITR